MISPVMKIPKEVAACPSCRGLLVGVLGPNGDYWAVCETACRAEPTEDFQEAGERKAKWEGVDRKVDEYCKTS